MCLGSLDPFTGVRTVSIPLVSTIDHYGRTTQAKVGYAFRSQVNTGYTYRKLGSCKAYTTLHQWWSSNTKQLIWNLVVGGSSPTGGERKDGRGASAPPIQAWLNIVILLKDWKTWWKATWTEQDWWNDGIKTNPNIQNWWYQISTQISGLTHNRWTERLMNRTNAIRTDGMNRTDELKGCWF
jgi:hypothetical protein